ncbi:hypothetical protein ACWD26_24975 [Streptomyces sp. NPDC002787]
MDPEETEDPTETADPVETEDSAETTDPVETDDSAETTDPVETEDLDEAVVGQVPDELVGEWDGDGDGSARIDKIAFFGDGTVSLLYNNRQVLEGPAVVEESRMTLYVPGGPITYESWYIQQSDIGYEYGYAFESLFLDGVSYVRQIS